jgi:hypothetical protein
MQNPVTNHSHSVPGFIDTADPAWYPRVLRALERDYPEINEKVWSTAISENAGENLRRYSPGKQ